MDGFLNLEKITQLASPCRVWSFHNNSK